jgi:hypothetical protein
VGKIQGLLLNTGGYDVIMKYRGFNKIGQKRTELTQAVDIFQLVKIQGLYAEVIRFPYVAMLARFFLSQVNKICPITQ